MMATTPRALTPSEVRAMLARKAEANTLREGDHVQMLSGVHRRRTGIVKAVDGWRVTVTLDCPWVGLGIAVTEYDDTCDQLELVAP